MINTVPRLRFSDLFKFINPKKYNLKTLTDYNFIWSDSGALAIANICNQISSDHGNAHINLLLPNYFCGQTLKYLRSSNVNLFFYSFKDNLIPDFDEIKEIGRNNKIDALIHVHYFGKIAFQEEIKNTADYIKSILIEDCAHIISPISYDKWVGDYIIFSPYKFYALPICNLTLSKKTLWENTQERKFPFIWILKQLLKKYLKRNKSVKWHRNITYNQAKPKKISPNKVVSNLAIDFLNNFNQYKNQRILISKALIKLLLTFPGWRLLINFNNQDNPYLIAMICDTKKIAKERFNALNKKEQIVFQWPDIPYELNEDFNKKEQVLDLYDRVICFPIHHHFNISEHINRINKIMTSF